MPGRCDWTIYSDNHHSTAGAGNGPCSMTFLLNLAPPFSAGFAPPPTQATVRFLRVLIPAPPTVFLAVHLPLLQWTGAWREIGVSAFPTLPIRILPDLSVQHLSIPRWHYDDVHPFQRDATGHLPFWSEPFSSFGSSRLTRIQSTVHARCACGICLAPTSCGCWQCRFLPGHPGESPVRRVRCSRSFEPDRYQSRMSG
jgi:hypothetical protein